MVEEEGKGKIENQPRPSYEKVERVHAGCEEMVVSSRQRGKEQGDLLSTRGHEPTECDDPPTNGVDSRPLFVANALEVELTAATPRATIYIPPILTVPALDGWAPGHLPPIHHHPCQTRMLEMRTHCQNIGAAGRTNTRGTSFIVERIRFGEQRQKWGYEDG
jgi:hypothetical protein